MRFPRGRFTIIRMMMTVVILAFTFSLLRPLTVPAARRAAEKVLIEYVPKSDPDFQLSDYRAEDAVRMPTGMWKVRFVRISGSCFISRAAARVRMSCWRD